MSNYLAIATVTATINELLSAGIGNDDPPINYRFKVTNRPPDIIISHPPSDIDVALNIFLYHVTQNIGYRNLDQPARSNDGQTFVKRPQLGLNLHYMITALATEENEDVNALREQEILASAMRILHENPTLTREMIIKTVTTPPYTGPNPLTGSDLADQVELVKITPQSLTLEEITKLWSSFFQINYRISATYEATVVLLDSVYKAKPTLPVLIPQIATLPFRNPIINQVRPQILEYLTDQLPPSRALTLLGQNFQADNVAVLIDERSVTVDLSNLSDTQIKVPLSLYGGLTAGIKRVQVVHGLNLRETGLYPNETFSMHRGFESNVVPFVLAPKITYYPPNPIPRESDLTVSVAPDVAPKQSVSFLIGDYEIPISPPESGTGVLSVHIPTSLPTAQGTIPFPTGHFLVRIRVDGADSLLQVDNNPASGTYGQFIKPAIDIQ